jgi:hypothetical protein
MKGTPLVGTAEQREHTAARRGYGTGPSREVTNQTGDEYPVSAAGRQGGPEHVSRLGHIDLR